MVDVNRLSTTIREPIRIERHNGVDTTPVDTVVFPSDKRRILEVNPNQVLIITAYGLSAGDIVTVSKVLRSGGTDAYSTGGCCDVIEGTQSVILAEVEIPCWTMVQGSPITVIRLVGAYTIDVDGEAEQDVRVTAQIIKMQDLTSGNICDRVDEELDTEPPEQKGGS